MTVFVYVNTSKQVGDAEHVKVFANPDAAEECFEENDPEGLSAGPLTQCLDLGADGRLAGAGIAVAAPAIRNAPGPPTTRRLPPAGA
jgi:hypothetical protein